MSELVKILQRKIKTLTLSQILTIYLKIPTFL